MKNMALCNYIVVGLGIIISCLIMNAASEFPLEFTVNGPGAGFWPFSLGVALFLAAIVLFAYTLIHKEELSHTKVALSMPPNKRVYFFMAVIVIYCVVINLLGFYAASLILIPVIMKMMDCADKKVIALTAVGTIVFVYLVFGEILNTNMPESIFLE